MTFPTAICSEFDPASTCAGPSRTVVDMGSKSGLSALFFLTRNPDAFAYLFEPNPANQEGLNENLRAYYGRIDGVHDACIAIDDILPGIISEGGEIDLRKIDTGGSEQELVRAIPEDLMPRIKLILLGTRPSGPLRPQHCTQEQYGSVCLLQKRNA